MPSSIGAMTAAAAVPLILWGLHRADVVGRVIAAVLVVGTVLIGVSMVYLGAHWLSDVLAGWALGAGIGVLAFRLQRGRRLPSGARAGVGPRGSARDDSRGRTASPCADRP